MTGRAIPTRAAYQGWIRQLVGGTLTCGHSVAPQQIVVRGEWYEPVLCLECPRGKRRKRRLVSVRWTHTESA